MKIFDPKLIIIKIRYISFLAKFRNNPPRAYTELKKLLCKRANISSYFRSLSKIMSENIEFMMD